jgi:hypothetical protein
MNCDFCQNTLKSKYYYNRHILKCKDNPNRQIKITYTETDMLLKDKEIELLKIQLIESEKSRQLNFNNFEILYNQHIKLQESFI